MTAPRTQRGPKACRKGIDSVGRGRVRRGVFLVSLPVALVTLALASVWLKNDDAPARSSRFLHLPLLADPLLRFAMLIKVVL